MTRYHTAGPWHPTENCPSGCYRKTKDRWPGLAFSVTTVSQEGAGVRKTFNYMSLYIFACMRLEPLPTSTKFHKKILLA